MVSCKVKPEHLIPVLKAAAPVQVTGSAVKQRFGAYKLTEETVETYNGYQWISLPFKFGKGFNFVVDSQTFVTALSSLPGSSEVELIIEDGNLSLIREGTNMKIPASPIELSEKVEFLKKTKSYQLSEKFIIGLGWCRNTIGENPAWPETLGILWQEDRVYSTNNITLSTMSVQENYKGKLMIPRYTVDAILTITESTHKPPMLVTDGEVIKFVWDNGSECTAMAGLTGTSDFVKIHKERVPEDITPMLFPSALMTSMNMIMSVLKEPANVQITIDGRVIYLEAGTHLGKITDKIVTNVDMGQGKAIWDVRWMSRLLSGIFKWYGLTDRAVVLVGSEGGVHIVTVVP